MKIKLTDKEKVVAAHKGVIAAIKLVRARTCASLHDAHSAVWTHNASAERKPPKMKMWIGNLDGTRSGLVITRSKERARKIIGRCSRQEFEDYWVLQDRVDEGMEFEVLYTRPIPSTGNAKAVPWSQGIVQQRYVKNEQAWREWLSRVAEQLGALLADTVDMEPSLDEGTRDVVNRLIALEQELSLP